MIVTINKDQWGIQLCTDKEECDHSLDLFDRSEIVDIRNACNK